MWTCEFVCGSDGTKKTKKKHVTCRVDVQIKKRKMIHNFKNRAGESDYPKIGKILTIFIQAYDCIFYILTVRSTKLIYF